MVATSRISLSLGVANSLRDQPYSRPWRRAGPARSSIVVDPAGYDRDLLGVDVANGTFEKLGRGQRSRMGARHLGFRLRATHHAHAPGRLPRRSGAKAGARSWERAAQRRGYKGSTSPNRLDSVCRDYRDCTSDRAADSVDVDPAFRRGFQELGEHDWRAGARRAGKSGLAAMVRLFAALWRRF